MIWLENMCELWFVRLFQKFDLKLMLFKLFKLLTSVNVFKDWCQRI
jgi:hypothetical protein